MKRFVFIGLLTCVAGFLIRFLNLRQATDDLGLPVSHHITTIILIIYLIAVLALMLILAFRTASPKSSAALTASPAISGSILKITGSVILLAGIFAEYFSSGNSTGSMVLFLSGIVAALCMILTCPPGFSQKTKTGICFIPIIYVLFRLMYLFKTTWSIDPIILDYCFQLFALIFTLIGLYFCAGFFFREGKPRLTLFMCSAACLFCAVSAADGCYHHDISISAVQLGFFFIMLSFQLTLSSYEG